MDYECNRCIHLDVCKFREFFNVLHVEKCENFLANRNKWQNKDGKKYYSELSKEDKEKYEYAKALDEPCCAKFLSSVIDDR